MRPALSKAQRQEWNTLRKTIGTNMQRYRHQRGLSLAYCARKMAISPDILDDYELGKRSITVLHLLRFAHAVETPFMELLGSRD